MPEKIIVYKCNECGKRFEGSEEKAEFTEKQAIKHEKMRKKEGNLHGLVLKNPSMPGLMYMVLRKSDFLSKENHQRIYGMDSFFEGMFEEGILMRSGTCRFKQTYGSGWDISFFEEQIRGGDYQELSRIELEKFVALIQRNKFLKDFYKDINFKRESGIELACLVD